MQSQTVNYKVDGVAMKGQIFRPASRSDQCPAVLVFPEAFGLTEHTLSKAEQLAEAGYIALACDLHGDAKIINDREERMAALGPLLNDALRVRAAARAALDALLVQPQVDPSNIAAIGFCFGGTMALELACSGAAITAAVGFHCGLSTISTAEASAVRGKILVCLGDADPSVPPQHREAFESAFRKTDVDWQIHLYGGVVHAFTNPQADALGRPEFARYDANADRRSWDAMLSLLREAFQGEAD